MGSTGTGNHGNKVAPGDKRLHIDGLMPDTKYAVQVRAVDKGVDSKWSQKYHIETIDDTAGGSRTPPVPELTSFSCESGQFVAVWNTVNTYDDGVSVMVVNSYEIELSGAFGTIISPHYGTATDTQTRSWSFAVLKALFGGNLPTSLTARLRVLSSARTPSEWSLPLTASLPVPNPPTNPKAEGVVDGIKVTWEPPTDPIHLFGYRVYSAIGDENAAFIPSPMNLVYQGGALETTYTSLTYDKMHYFKIVSYSEAGLESTWVEASAKPVSPYGPDTTPPTKPVLNNPTMDRAVVTNPKAVLSWTHDDTVDPNKDTAGFVIRWRLDNETRWRNAYFDKAAREGVIDLPRPFSNYVFEISAYDFVANYSDYADTAKTLTGAGPAPDAVTGVDAVARWDGLRIFWDESTESVKYGGHYDVQYNTTGTWATDAPVDYVTGSLSIDITNLNSLTKYYYRVRAVDSAGQVGAWSEVGNKTLPAFPVANATDGAAPTSAPANVRSTGGLNYVNVAWDRVQNNDPVWYEVHMSEVNNFPTLNASTFVGEATGTSLMVASKPNGSPLEQEKTYYFKVRVMDADCKDGVVGPTSAQTSSQLTQVLSTDLGINMGGENLLYNSGFEADSNGDGMADFWQIVNSEQGVVPITATGVTGMNNSGRAQRIAWNGAQTTEKGITSKDKPVLRPNTEFVFSIYARGNGGYLRFTTTGGAALTATAMIDDPGLHPTTWRRFVYRGTTGTTPYAGNINYVVVQNPNSVAWVEFDDAQIEAGNTASAYKTGTVSIAKLTSGRMSTAEMIVESNGIVKSTDYDPATRKGWAIHNGGIDVFRGQVLADSLVANSAIVSNMYVNAVLEISSGGTGGKLPGYIKSSNYRPPLTNGPTDEGAGFRIDSAGIDIRSGTIGVKNLVGGTISASDIKIGANGKITIDSTGSIVSNNYSYTAPVGSIPASGTGWRLSKDGIEMWDDKSKINVNALETSTLSTAFITIGSGGELKSAAWDSGVGARWRLNDEAFTMYNGAITGAVIQTGALTSINQVPAEGGVNRPAFDINAGGYTAITGLRVYGNSVVGNHVDNVLQSGNFNNSTLGWKIWGSGLAQFNQVNTRGLRVEGDAIVSGSSAHNLRSDSFSYNSGGNGGTGWILRGDGYAEFNAGMLSVGNAGGGRVMATLDANGTNAMLRFYQPGNTTSFGNIRQRADNVLEMRGGWGGAITFNPAWYTGRTLVQIAQDLDVTGMARVDNGIVLEQGGMNIKGGGLGLNGGINIRNGGLDVSGADFISRVTHNTLKNNVWLPDLSAPNGGGKREVLIEWNGVLIGGQQRNSTIRVKKNVRDYSYTKDQILSLRPVHYQLKDEYWTEDAHNENSFAGVIAEEAEELGLGDFLVRDREGKVDEFDYPRFTSALLHVAREQQKEIDELKQAVEKLLGRS